VHVRPGHGSPLGSTLDPSFGPSLGPSLASTFDPSLRPLLNEWNDLEGSPFYGKSLD
jgi:hypothetical protein